MLLFRYLGGSHVPRPLLVLLVTAVLVNAFNLLPFEPLDGGRLVSTLISSRAGRWEAAVRRLPSIVAVLWALSTQRWLLAFVFLLGYGQALVQTRFGKIAATLRLGYPQSLAACDEPQLRELYAAAVQVPSRSSSQPIQPVVVAAHMRRIHERRVFVPATPLATVLLLAVYLGTVGVLLATFWSQRSRFGL